MQKEIIQPKGLINPSEHKGFDPSGLPWSQAVKAEGKLLFISGQTSVDEKGRVVGKGEMTTQVRQSIKNLELVVKAAGGDLSNVVYTTWFVTSIKDFYEKGASTIRREMFKRDFPTSTLVEIKRLADPDYLCEVEAIAVL